MGWDNWHNFACDVSEDLSCVIAGAAEEEDEQCAGLGFGDGAGAEARHGAVGAAGDWVREEEAG